MSKIIKMTPEIISELKSAFDEALKMTKAADGKISFTKTLGTKTDKARVIFTVQAYTKMAWLIRNFDKEVAWHGVAYRGDDESSNDYYITDILVYPQEVTGATVNTDQDAYQEWLYSLDDDQFNNLRMQGHSHVNMGVTPSGVDLTHQERILEQLDDDMFYIFMIWNKSFTKNVKIYDMAKNTLFESDDVTVMIDNNGVDMDAFEKAAKSMVKDKTYTAPKQNSTASASKYGTAVKASTEKASSSETEKKRAKAYGDQGNTKGSETTKATDNRGSYCYGYSGSIYSYIEDGDDDWRLRDPFYASDSYYGR